MSSWTRYSLRVTHLLHGVGGDFSVLLVDGGDTDLSIPLRPGLTKIFHLAECPVLSSSDCCAGPRSLPAISLALSGPSRLLRSESVSEGGIDLSLVLRVGLSEADTGIAG